MAGQLALQLVVGIMPSAAGCALGDPSCFIWVNASALSRAATLQLVVAQGLANREFAASVYVSDIGRFPGMRGIEWFPGTGDGRWGSWTCPECAGLRGRWLETIVQDSGRSAVLSSPASLLSAVLPLARGGARYSESEPHSLGPVLTLCGLDALLPTTEDAPLPPPLQVRFDARSRFADALSAATFVGRELLPRTNRTTLAVQAPTNLPFLADAIVSWRLATVWMDDMCADRGQSAAFRWIVEGSGHFDEATSVQYVGWFNRTRNPNPEVLAECTAAHRLYTVASDWTENLSFLSSLPPARTLAQPTDARTEGAYDASKVYVAVIMSDGDNLAEDYSTLRPALERRLAQRSSVPISWTVSNRWLRWGAPLLRWFYAAAARGGPAGTGGYDSFLMGPSGYGYLFPGNMSAARDRAEWARRTAEAASRCGMQAYVHWDVDTALDAAAGAKAARAIASLNGTVVRGAFMLASVHGVPSAVGDVAVISSPPVPWGFQNATTVAADLGRLAPGTVTYARRATPSPQRLQPPESAASAPGVVLVTPAGAGRSRLV